MIKEVYIDFMFIKLIYNKKEKTIMNKLIKIARKIVDGEDYSQYDKTFVNGIYEAEVKFAVDDENNLYAKIDFPRFNSDFVTFSSSLDSENIDNEIYHVECYLKSLKEANEYISKVLKQLK